MLCAQRRRRAVRLLPNARFVALGRESRTLTPRFSDVISLSCPDETYRARCRCLRTSRTRLYKPAQGDTLFLRGLRAPRPGTSTRHVSCAAYTPQRVAPSYRSDGLLVVSIGGGPAPRACETGGRGALSADVRLPCQHGMSVQPLG